MQQQTGVFNWRPAKERSGTRDLLFLGSFVLYTAWRYSSQGDFNPMILALAFGTGLSILLKALHAPWDWRMRAFGFPVLILAIAAIATEDRLWLLPLWILLATFFGAMALTPSSKIEVGEDAIVLRSLGVRRTIPYGNIADIEVFDVPKNSSAVTLKLHKPANGLWGRLWGAEKVPILIEMGDVPAFVESVRRHLVGVGDAQPSQ